REQGLQHRPGDPEHGLLVAHLDVAPGQEIKDLAIAPDFGKPLIHGVLCPNPCSKVQPSATGAHAASAACPARLNSTDTCHIISAFGVPGLTHRTLRRPSVRPVATGSLLPERASR